MRSKHGLDQFVKTMIPPAWIKPKGIYNNIYKVNIPGLHLMFV